MSSPPDPADEPRSVSSGRRVAVHDTGEPRFDTEAHLMSADARDELDRLRREWRAEPSHG